MLDQFLFPINENDSKAVIVNIVRAIHSLIKFHIWKVVKKRLIGSKDLVIIFIIEITLLQFYLSMKLPLIC